MCFIFFDDVNTSHLICGEKMLQHLLQRKTRGSKIKIKNSGSSSEKKKKIKVLCVGKGKNWREKNDCMHLQCLIVPYGSK